MVVIRLARKGAKKKPFYQIVVADQRFKRDGRFIERLGFYNPIATKKEVALVFKNERVNYWISVGAQLSNRVANLWKSYNDKK